MGDSAAGEPDVALDQKGLGRVDEMLLFRAMPEGCRPDIEQLRHKCLSRTLQNDLFILILSVISWVLCIVSLSKLHGGVRRSALTAP